MFVGVVVRIANMCVKIPCMLLRFMPVIAEVVKVARCVCSTAISPQLFFVAWLRNVEGMAA